MPWMPGIPSDPAQAHGGLIPTGVVLHRTIGHWAGDYTILKNGGLCHFLVGELDGQVVQFADTNTIQYHAGGANDWAVGIEFSGQNGAPLTAWQLEKGTEIIQWLSSTHGIPLEYNDGSGGRNGPVNMFVAHNYVYEPEDQHVDYVNLDDWAYMAQEDDMATWKDWSLAERLEFGKFIQEQCEHVLKEKIAADNVFTYGKFIQDQVKNAEGKPL